MGAARHPCACGRAPGAPHTPDCRHAAQFRRTKPAARMVRQREQVGVKEFERRLRNATIAKWDRRRRLDEYVQAMRGFLMTALQWGVW